MKKRIKTKEQARKVACLHLVLSLGLFFAYVAFSILYSPGFFLSDARSKLHAVADTVTVAAIVLPPPAKPTPTASAVCDEDTGTLSVELDWADDDGTYFWDIDRDSSALISGVTDSEYSDTTVSVGTTYAYVVTANGPMGPGTVESDPVSVTTPSECEVTAASPTVTVTLLNGKSVSQTTKTTDRTPRFAGTTNMPNASITFFIHDKTDTYATTTANANGYWEWTSPITLSYGTHTLSITATDPDDSSRSVSTSFSFKVKEASSDEGDDDEEAEDTVAVSLVSAKPPTPSVQLPQEVAISPLDFAFTASDEVVQGKSLKTTLLFTRLEDAFIGMDAIVRYSVIGADGSEKAELLKDITLDPRAAFFEDIAIDKFLDPGQYRVRAEVIFNSYNISQEAFFSVLPLPVLDFGGTAVVTYPDILSMMGTISLWLLLFLILWTGLFFREYWLSAHALRQVTGRNLAFAGFLGKRKGVRK